MIRILLDECLPVKLMYRFQEYEQNFEVSTVTAEKWTGIKNGILLDKAQETFDVFVTIDQNLSYQQDLSNFDIAIVAIQAKSNRYKDLLKFVEPASKIIKNTEAKKFYTV
ncbi:MAG: hypothetical protein U5K72_06915 [Balneolaceae bacterium]|nr:hypothetical protein [Balneolaceae bacterium]